MKHQLVILAAAAALVATAVVAGDGEKKPQGASSTFEMLDKDSDGKLSREEISGSENLAASFAMLDKDSDGFVSKGEFRRNTRTKPDSGY
jgi:Ca2+-binding EF-hand superfamily protein